MEFIEFNSKKYPKFQAQGNAAQFAIPYALHFCKGRGYDIGCCKKEWSFPGSISIDKTFNNGYDAYNLPELEVDYIYSSHCLEHLESWIDAIRYWTTKLKRNGILFLYLPDYSQEYWRPWNNIKHKHVLNKKIIIDFLISLNFKNLFSSGVDLNNSFIIVAEKS